MVILNIILQITNLLCLSYVRTLILFLLFFLCRDTRLPPKRLFNPNITKKWKIKWLFHCKFKRIFVLNFQLLYPHIMSDLNSFKLWNNCTFFCFCILSRDLESRYNRFHRLTLFLCRHDLQKNTESAKILAAWISTSPLLWQNLNLN
jgi:hypothetical protein